MLLTVSELTVRFGETTVLDRFGLGVEKSEIVGLSGASGSGKTVLAAAVMGMLEAPGHIANGRIIFDGRVINSLTERELRTIRGHEIGMIFQDPIGSFNPSRKISAQFREALGRESYNSQAEELLLRMRFAEPRKILNSYPFELSGGMCQRAAIAVAIAPRPKLLIADEPTTALDIKNQSQIMALLGEIREKFGVAILLISHDKPLLSEIADRVVEMPSHRNLPMNSESQGL
jgi:peptide/nickel transport system ATP-binding protein